METWWVGGVDRILKYQTRITKSQQTWNYAATGFTLCLRWICNEC